MTKDELYAAVFAASQSGKAASDDSERKFYGHTELAATHEINAIIAKEGGFLTAENEHLRMAGQHNAMARRYRREMEAPALKIAAE
jgi:hypothetical protein